MEAEKLVSVERLSKDLARAAISLSVDEARFLVDAYYQMQRDRIRSGHQTRTLAENQEPSTLLAWLASQSETLEKQIKRALDRYSAASPLGEWARDVCGIGPVIASGLLCHINLDKAPTVGHIWRFAGLDPTSKWEKGKKRPHNAALKRLCWLIGESFVKVKGNDADVYGKLYDARKLYEQAKNDQLEYAAQAAAVLKTRPTHAQRATYAAGKLPDGHLHARAKRYAVKQFLADYHAAGFKLAGKVPPLPYPIAILGHAHHRQP